MSAAQPSSNIETDYLAYNSKNEWSALYQKIRTETTKNSKPFSEALKPQNKDLNRYRDVSPYDHSRIILQRGATDYINANLIKIARANRSYILTQGPLEKTVSHFWLMVWEQHSKAVLMLNKLVEKKQEKCFQYWPAKVGPEHAITMQDVGLTLEYIEQQDHSYYLTRVLRLTDTETGTQRDILQFHYTTWPDFGVPTSPTAFLEFLRRVRDAGVLEESVGPAIVHCSAGIGRSGTFCLVDSCLVLIEKFGLNSVDIKEILYEMRSYRMGLIQTPEQLRFSYQAIIEGAKQLENPSKEQENHIELINNVCHGGEGGGGDDEVNEASDSDVAEDDDEDDDDDGPPPLPPPRLDSLKKLNGGTPLDRPLPQIPQSISLHDIEYEEHENESYVPSGPLPVVPADEASSGDEVEDENEPTLSESPCSEPSNISDSLSPSELRHRKRIENKEKLEAKVNEMKRRQQVSEQWTQLKRSLYKPFLITGFLGLAGGLVAYIYFKN